MDYVVQLAILVYWTIGSTWQYIYGSFNEAVPSIQNLGGSSLCAIYFTCTEAVTTQIADGSTPV